MTKTEMEIIVEKKTVYGNDLIFPVNETAEIFAKIAGTKTLSRDTINHIKVLGYAVVLKQQQL